MKLIYKDDWDEARRRMEAWWKGEIVDRVSIKITAPIQKRKIKKDESCSLSIDNLKDYFTDPKQVIPRLEEAIENTYWAGEAFPVMFPVSIVNFISC